MSEFKNYHPIVNFVYFAAVIGFSVVFMNPLCLAAGFASGFIYSVMLGGTRALKFNLYCIIPLLFAAVLLNPLINHEGATILSYLPDGNPLTMESVVYGAASAFMLAGVICWFSCFNKVMTSDKLIYLFGKLTPALSLVLSMIFRFVPRFAERIRIISDGRRCMELDRQDKSVIQKSKNGIRILSAMMSWSLEDSIDTADSMKCRGYGTGRRTAYSNFRFDRRDAAALLIIVILSVYITVGGINGGLYFKYFPFIAGSELSPYVISLGAAYCLLFFMPMIIEAAEELRWKKLKSRI